MTKQSPSHKSGRSKRTVASLFPLFRFSFSPTFFHCGTVSRFIQLSIRYSNQFIVLGRYFFLISFYLRHLQRPHRRQAAVAYALMRVLLGRGVAPQLNLLVFGRDRRRKQESKEGIN